MSEYRIDVDARLKNGSQTDVQKQLDSIMKNITADTTLAIDFAKSKVEIQQQTANIAKYIQTEFNKVAKSLKLPEMTDKNALKIANGYVKESVQAMKQQVKEQEKLNALQAKEDKKKQIQQEKELVTLRKEQFEYEQKRQQYKAEGAKQTEEVKNQQALMDAYKQAEEYTLREKEYLSQRNALIAEGVKQEKEYSAEVAKASTIDQKIANGQVSKDVGSITSKYNGLNTTTTATVIPESLKTDYQSLIALSEKLNTSLSDKEKNATWLQYQNTLASVKNHLSVVSTTTKQLATEQSRLSQAGEMTKWLQNNSKATTTFGNEINTMVAKLLSADDMTVPELEKILAEFQKIKMAAREANKIGFSFGDKLKNGLAKFGNWFGVAAIFTQTIQAGKKVVSNVIEIDTAMTDLRKVCDATDAEFKSFLTTATENAKQLGASISDVVSATADFARLGYNLPDATELARVATLYKNVGDIDISDATTSIISTMKAFNISADESEKIVDVFNEVGNRFAISSAGIGDSLQRSASSLVEANNTLEQATALSVGANDVLQDPEKVGTMWNTASLRIRGAKTELEDAGLETDGLVESTSKLQAQIKGMTGFDILESDQKTFKSTYDIIVGIGEEYKKLDDVSQASLLELLGGKRQANALASALNNVEDIKNAYQVATDSAGSAAKEQAEHEKSIQHSLDRMGASAQAFSESFLNSGLVKGIVDLGTLGVDGITKLTDAFGALGTVGLGAGLFAGIQNVGRDNRYLVTYAYPC